MDNNFVNEELDFDLIDLCKTIIKKWKLVILFAAIFALILGIYALRGNMNIAKSENNSNNTSDYSAFKTKLTDEEISNVESAAAIINDYREKYTQQQNYNQNSIYQNLDAHNIDTIVLTYYVDNYYQITYPTISEQNDLVPIIQTYASLLQDEKIFSNLTELIGGENPLYYKELISTDLDQQEYGVLTVTIYASSEEQLSKISNFIKQTLADCLDEVENTYGTHELKLVSETYSKTVSYEMAEQQQKNIQKLTETTTAIANIEKMYTGDSLNYLKALVHESLVVKKNVLVYAGLGALIGIVAVVVYVSLIYLFSNTVKTEKEFEKLYGTPSLGKIKDREVMATKINLLAKANGCKKLALISKLETADCKLIANQLNDSLPVIGIDCFQYDENVEAINDCDAIVVFEKEKVSKRKDVEKIIKICGYSNIQILGIVME